MTDTVKLANPLQLSELDANARLVLAAPELLEALFLALKCANDHGGDHFGYGEYADHAQHAIESATGKTGKEIWS
jgi:hypothetical protein